MRKISCKSRLEESLDFAWPETSWEIYLSHEIGQLWENFLIAERQKLLNYYGFYGRTYFWRTVRGQEVDYLEEIDSEIHAFEFKWSPKAKGKIPKSFIEAYNPKTVKIIHRENFWEWLGTYPYGSGK